MARLRGSTPTTGRPVVPTRLLRCDDLDWLTPEELERHSAQAKGATTAEIEDAAVQLGITARRRWRDARRSWEAEHGHTIERTN